jgi:hypothetical protein
MLEICMKKVLVCAALLLACLPANAQLIGMRSLGFAPLTVSAATPLPSIPGGTLEALVVCEAQNVRWRDDGTAPTATVGMLLQPGVAFPYIGSLPRIQFIQATSGAACNVTYYGY